LAATDSVSVRVAKLPAHPASVALAQNVKLPSAADDPASVPLAASVMPHGSAPLSSDQL